MEATNEELREKMEEMYEFLMTSGVPEQSIEDLKELVVADKVFDALVMIENYTTCFPYMETSALIFMLSDGWEIYAKRAQQVVSKAISAIAKIVADGNKAAEGAEEKAKDHKENCEDARTRTNIKLYKMRALRKVWDQKVNGGGGEEGGKEGEEKDEPAAAPVEAA
ncbi:hypothetical protein TrRE_jg4683 [Triparma retinervis]|uniref:Uncharacterized protein n=1 Tax=Triparma retinervis TaxID=2557542 RepID=A0A9W7A977_9STRA|nr:hypothetical protein TrRE_jg4683 [Triparma retinervis]